VVCEFGLSTNSGELVQCIQEGFRLEIILGIPIEAAQEYKLTIKNFSNSHTTHCISLGVMISIADPTKRTVILKSPLGLSNMEN